ncbi:MAG: sensor histidine kinase [Actinomycetaceae bacterium]
MERPTRSGAAVTHQATDRTDAGTGTDLPRASDLPSGADLTGPDDTTSADRDSDSDDLDPWDNIGWLMAVIWLIFLVFPVIAVFELVGPVWLQALDLVLIGAFALIYGWAFRTLPVEPGLTRRRHGIRYLVVLVAIIAAVTPSLGYNTMAMNTYVVALSIFCLPRLAAVLVTAAAVFVATVPPLIVPGLTDPDDGPWWIYGPIIMLVAVACFIPAVLDERSARQRRLRTELALTEERERVARDVHDVLGHSLTVITVKSELAERLVDLDPDRAKQEMAQVRSLSRQSLAEIRATVAGLRVARLTDELEAAATALAGAGIEADLPDDHDVVDPRHRITFAWALREAVTNVVRHSGASRCTVAWGEDWLTVTDDGRGFSGGREGNGLRGLRERVAQAGGSVELGPAPDGAVHARTGASGPGANGTGASGPGASGPGAVDAVVDLGPANERAARATGTRLEVRL